MFYSSTSSARLLEPLRLSALVVCIGLTGSCSDTRSPTAASPVPSATTLTGQSGGTEVPAGAPAGPIERPSQTVLLAGAGDIADSEIPATIQNSAKTAQLLAGLPPSTLVFTAGDNEQSNGSYEKFMTGFDKTWGQLRNRKLPVVGNHDFTPGFFQYFGSETDPARHGYYSVRLSDSWQFIALNSQVDSRNGSAQYVWLTHQLAQRSPCTIVVYHQPLQTNSLNESARGMRDAWNLLYKAGAEIVVNGHNHVYERFPPKDDSLRVDPAFGVRQFTVGTGGYNSYDFRRAEFDYDVRFMNVHGIISFMLESGRYQWEFISTNGTLDSGAGECHAAPTGRV